MTNQKVADITSQRTQSIELTGWMGKYRGLVPYLVGPLLPVVVVVVVDGDGDGDGDDGDDGGGGWCCRRRRKTI